VVVAAERKSGLGDFLEQPDKFELIVNLNTAKMFGLTIPQSILLRVDQVIQ